MAQAPRFPVILAAAILLPLCVTSSAQTAGTKAPHPLLVGYFPQWGLYFAHPYYVKALVTNKAANNLDQINYSQGSVSNGHCALADPDADLSIRFSRQNSVNGKTDKPTARFRGYFHQL